MTLSFPQGHGALSRLPPGPEWAATPATTTEHEDPEINAYFKDVYEKRLAKLKGIGPMKTGGTPSTIFPNMSFGAGPHLVLHRGMAPAGGEKHRDLALVHRRQGRCRRR